MRILVINSGSSSIKFQLLQMADESLLLAGLLERIGEGEASLHLQLAGAQGQRRSVLAVDHQQGMGLILDALQQAQ
ncbi:MAG: acetate kinase, partial [Gammaproteobacteria bacterium SHHR-1]